LRQKLGEFYGRFPVHQHRWLDSSSLHEFGRISDGTRVMANRLLAENDFVLGLGSIVPHRIKGFSGGAKIAFPGVAGREMQERNQWDAARRLSETVMGVAENPMRLRMEEAAHLAGLRYVVNLVSDREKKIVGCFFGDPVQAHRAGCKLSREINAVTGPRRKGRCATAWRAYSATR
jgi:nickel-dependent lactate racemase